MFIVTLRVKSQFFTAKIARSATAHQEEVKSGQPAPLDERSLVQDPSKDDLGPALKNASAVDTRAANLTRTETRLLLKRKDHSKNL